MSYKFFIPQLMVLLFRIFNFQVCRALCRQHKGGARFRRRFQLFRTDAAPLKSDEVLT